MKWTYRIGWIFFRTVSLTYFRCRYHNPENVPLQGPVILAANHASFIDPPIVGAGLSRDLNYLARESLFANPILGPLLREVNVVPVDRDGGGAAGLRAILNRLLDGAAILLFPEGTRTTDGQIHAARAGIGLTIVKSAAPVVPVRIFGTYEAWGRHSRLPRPLRVEVKYGTPLAFSALRNEAQDCSKTRLKAIYQELSSEIMSSIRQLQPCTHRAAFP